MEIGNILVLLAFLVGAGCAFYILTHLKDVIVAVNQWRAASIAALCISAFLFFAFSHPKVTKVVADFYGMKLDLTSLEKVIKEKQAIVKNLDAQVNSSQSELVELQNKMDAAYVAKISKPMSESLKKYQKEGNPIALFPGNQIAINPKLAAQKAGVAEIPEKFKKLSPDSWLVLHDGGIGVEAEATNVRANASSVPRSFILNSTGESSNLESLSNSDSAFLKSLIQKSDKGPANGN
jgi:hypothetical protein